MAYFGKYIRQILSRQEAVIFPGFGSLVIKESRGIEGAGGTIDPPGALIMFDPTHPKDDQKLATEYSSGEGIELEEARQQLLELVDAIKFKLDKGELYDLTLVGKFTRDDDNRIHFKKDPNWVIDPELFGLESLNLLELEREVENDPVKEIPAKIQSKTAPKEQVKKIPNTKGERKPANKWKIIWIVIGSLIAVLVVILLIPTGEGDNAIEFGKEGILIRNTDSEKDVKVTKQPVETRIKENPQEVEEVKLQELPDTKAPVVSENNYFIIAGSFESLQNASELMNKLTDKGFPAEIVYTENRLYRVAVKSYATKEAAIGELGRIKATPGLEKVWVWAR